METRLLLNHRRSGGSVSKNGVMKVRDSACHVKRCVDFVAFLMVE